MLADNYIKKLISEKAYELGFVKIGFARADILESESAKLQEWLDNGYDADMSWIEKGFEKRHDIKLIMDAAKTVISLAYNYYTPFKRNDKLPKISRYAWGQDYHKLLKGKLNELSFFIDSLGKNIRTKYYVDDGPVMDKAWAVRAGIGWMGKHTNVINPEYGSWIFLSEIITNLEFEIYDEPIEDVCGECRLCIEACPTGAIVTDYKLDSNLCISYQTIENHSEVPETLDLDGWVFGCDVCQDVCPFNKNDKPTSDKNYYPKAEICNKTSGELADISAENFKDLFKDSPIKRTKHTGWIRNLNRI
jgi:epoxyqueuosine reductase